MPHQEPYVLAIDIGSSSVKAGIYDAVANSLEHTQVALAHTQRISREGMHEEDAEQLRHVVESAVDLVLQKDARASAKLVAVGMDAMASTIIGLDRDLEPITPIYTYADTRTSADVEQLRKSIDVDAAYDRIGVMQHTSYVPARIVWLRRTQPEIFRRIARWSDVSTYIYSQWFGSSEVPSSYSIAAWSGLLNRRELAWDEEMMESIRISAESLPRLSPYTDMIRGLAQEYKTRWPQLSELPFMLAVGDGAAVNVGAGCIGSDSIALTVGTTGAMRLIVEDSPLHGPPKIPQGLWGYRLGADLTLLGGAFSEGGNVIDWARQALNISDLNALEEALNKTSPDSHGLTVLPFIAGERAVGWSTNAYCTVTDIRGSTTALDISQALMEAVAYRFSLVADLLSEHMDADRLFIAGGGAMTNSPWWTQTVADVLQSEVLVPADAQSTSRGTAVLTLHALGEWKRLDECRPPIAKTYRPRDTHLDVYRKAIERQRELYMRMVGPTIGTRPRVALTHMD